MSIFLQKKNIVSFILAVVVLLACERTVTSSYSPISPELPKPRIIPFFKAHAGEDTTVYIPHNVAILDASRSEDTGRIVSYYTWEQIVSDLLTVSFGKVGKQEVGGLQEGVYLFRLTATSKFGTTSSDTIRVTVIDQFAPGIPATAWHECDTLIRSEQEAIYPLNASAFVDSAGFRYNLFSGFTFTQLSGPSKVVLNDHPQYSNFVQITNVVKGYYSFQVEIDRKGLKTYDTLVLSVLPDTAIAKTYIFESAWKDVIDSFGTNQIVADVANIAGLLLSKTGRQIKVWISEDGSNSWSEIDNDWFFGDTIWGVVPCGNGLQVIRYNTDKSMVGKKVRIRISIIT